MKKHLPTLAIVLGGLVAMRLSMPHQGTPTPPPMMVESPRRATVASDTAPLNVTTRVVSCGGRGAGVVGNDSAGTVTQGSTPAGTCTVLFSQNQSNISCSATGGTVTKTLPTEFVISSMAGQTATYHCQ